MPSKPCQKIGYGKISLHINFFLLLSFNKSVKILWTNAKYTRILDVYDEILKVFYLGNKLI